MNTSSNVEIAPDKLCQCIADELGELAQKVYVCLSEVTVVTHSEKYLQAMQILRDSPKCCFDQLIDLCGVDYCAWRAEATNNSGFEEVFSSLRFCVVSHLLSVKLNQRVRMKVFCSDNHFPALPSVMHLWNSANWFEREAFDLYGIVFEGHTDLRRILTDYGFIGHPFRKDFPLSGNVEVSYDEEKKRVIYQPVSIEPREITPRVIREEHYGGLR